MKRRPPEMEGWKEVATNCGSNIPRRNGFGLEKWISRARISRCLVLSLNYGRGEERRRATVMKASGRVLVR